MADFHVVIYDFDPSTIVWPFRQQKTLPLHAGEKVKVIHDDGCAPQPREGSPLAPRAGRC